MDRAFLHIVVERNNDVFCVRLRRPRMNEADILDMVDELTSLINNDGCRKMSLSLGPGQLECLIASFSRSSSWSGA